MAQQPIGNESNMQQVRKLMEEQKLQSLAAEVNEGGSAQDVVTIDHVTAEGKHYTGKIQFKRPTVMEIMRMGGRKSEILRESGVQELTLVDPTVRMLAEAIATLEIVVVKCPEWFLNIGQIQDIEIIFHVSAKYEEWSNSFRLKVIREQAEDSATS